MIRKIYRNLPKKRLFLPIRKKRRIKRIMAKQIHIHTVLKKREGGAGETMPENDRLALASFGHRWNELARHEKMFLWTRCNYPIMFEFERPLTLANCRSITERISDWHDIERLMESIANRRDVPGHPHQRDRHLQFFCPNGCRFKTQTAHKIRQ